MRKPEKLRYNPQKLPFQIGEKVRVHLGDQILDGIVKSIPNRNKPKYMGVQVRRMEWDEIDRYAPSRIVGSRSWGPEFPEGAGTIINVFIKYLTHGDPLRWLVTEYDL